MTGLYIVLLDGTICGAYDTDEAAKHCQDYVAIQTNKTPEVRYIILNKNYWEQPDYTKYNPLYNFNENE